MSVVKAAEHSSDGFDATTQKDQLHIRTVFLRSGLVRCFVSVGPSRLHALNVESHVRSR